MHEAALEAVARRLSAAGVPFLLGGSGLLFALGLDVPVRDLDLMLRVEDRARLEAAAGDWHVGTTTEPGPVLTSAWKATLDVGGVEVEGLGGLGFAGGPRLPFRSGGSWRGVPLAAPEVWWAAYRVYKPERAALLEPLVDEQARARVLAEIGYDHVAERYLEAIKGNEADPRLWFLGDLAARLPDGAFVLDLGCGAGEPNARMLAKRFQVTGVDVSTRQLELACAAVPGAEFVHADMMEVEFPHGSFDAVVALYSIAHVARERHAALLGTISDWLRPGGLLLASLGVGDQPGAIEEEWLGVPMYFSSFDARENCRLLESAGFELLHDETIAAAGERFQWVLARTRTPSGPPSAPQNPQAGGSAPSGA